MNFQMNSSLKNLQNACEYENLVSVVHRHQLFVKCVQKKLRNKVVKIYPPRLYMSQKTLVCLAKNVPKFLMLEVFRKVHQELTTRSTAFPKLWSKRRMKKTKNIRQGSKMLKMELSTQLYSLQKEEGQESAPWWLGSLFQRLQ